MIPAMNEQNSDPSVKPSTGGENPNGDRDQNQKRDRKPIRPLRVWPAAVLTLVALLIGIVPRLIGNGPPWLPMIPGLGPLLCGLLILLWWCFASRATPGERFVGVAGIGVGLGVTFLLAHPTMRGPAAIVMVTAPLGLLAFALGTVIWAGTLTFKRTISAVLLAACGFALTNLLRLEGMTGTAALELRWRWTPSPEELLLAERESAPPAPASPSVDVQWEQALARPAWPGFRGPDRNGTQIGPAIATDWDTQPPRQLWKISVGPGWSSFAVAEPFLFTQEAAAYRLSLAKPNPDVASAPRADLDPIRDGRTNP